MLPAETMSTRALRPDVSGRQASPFDLYRRREFLGGAPLRDFPQPDTHGGRARGPAHRWPETRGVLLNLVKRFLRNPRRTKPMPDESL